MLNKINAEVVGIINRHFNELRRYTTFNPPADCEVAPDIMDSIKRLARFATCHPDCATEYMYREIHYHLSRVGQFLQEMGQPLDDEFRSTRLGALYLKASEWCVAVEQQNFPDTQDIWKLIAPASPDCLENLGNGIYEAKWWHPVPMMDIEILTRTEYVVAQGQPFEPTEMPNGLALRFSVPPFLDNAI